MCSKVILNVEMLSIMALTLNKGSADELEQICRQFLWGPCEQEHSKVPLVARDIISQPMLEGRLGILSFLKHSQLLKLCCASELVESQPTAWVRMAEDLIRLELKHGTFKLECMH